MKKQFAHPIKAHLIRSAFYLVLPLAVCVIHFALGQRSSNKQSVAAKPGMAANTKAAVAGARVDMLSFTGAAAISDDHKAGSEVPKTSIVPVDGHRLPTLPAPEAPQVVLYDQYNNAANRATLSSTFTDFPNDNSDLADDFVVPAGQTWNVESIDGEGYYLPPDLPTVSMFSFTPTARAFPGRKFTPRRTSHGRRWAAPLRSICPARQSSAPGRIGSRSKPT